jgi:hypothetical protein
LREAQGRGAVRHGPIWARPGEIEAVMGDARLLNGVFVIRSCELLEVGVPLGEAVEPNEGCGRE